MRRALPLLGFALALAGCGGGKVVSPLPQTVIGTVPTTQASTAPTPTPASGSGGAASGKSLFISNGCNSCHTYKPAGSNGTIGPDLDKLRQYAKQAKQPYIAFVRTSISAPNAYIQPGYPKGLMPQFPLSPAQLNALVTFLTTAK